MRKANCGFLGAAPAQVLLSYHGPAIRVDIGFDSEYVPNQTRPPRAQKTGIEALVDTGARECCIDSELARELDLPVIDRRFVSGVSGQIEVDFHLAQIYVPALKFTLRGRFAGLPLLASGISHPVVAGRSFLAYFKLNYDGPLGDAELIDP
jgi:hypothetical protein